MLQQHTQIYKIVILLSFLSIHITCKRANKTKTTSTVNHNTTYAQGFDIQYHKTITKLILYNSKNNNHKETYYLIPKKTIIPDSLKKENIIRTPIEKIVLTSTTHIPMLELLGVESTLIGFPNTKYISSNKTRQLIDEGKVQDLGQNQSLNTELLLDLQPELLIGFGINNSTNNYDKIKKLGIPVLVNTDWLEKTPLGKAEWLRFFGALYNKDSLAKVKFNEIANSYNALKKQAKKFTNAPTVISGALFQDVWYMPAGESFMAQFIADAHANYLWKDSKGSGSLSLSLERVLEKGQHAYYWIAPGFYTSKNAMLHDSPHYEQFKAFKEDNLYTYAIKTGATGGVLYFELATTRPDWVLEDLIQILHQTKLKRRNLHFFDKLN